MRNLDDTKQACYYSDIATETKKHPEPVILEKFGPRFHILSTIYWQVSKADPKG